MGFLDFLKGIAKGLIALVIAVVGLVGGWYMISLGNNPIVGGIGLIIGAISGLFVMYNRSQMASKY